MQAIIFLPLVSELSVILWLTSTFTVLGRLEKQKMKAKQINAPISFSSGKIFGGKGAWNYGEVKLGKSLVVSKE